MGYTPIYKQVITHLLTIDPNFLGHPSEEIKAKSKTKSISMVFWPLLQLLSIMSRQSTVQTGVMMNYQPKQCTTLRENPQNDQIIGIAWSPQDNVEKMSDFLKAHLKHSQD